ncbi:MAG: hypothetical protein NC115_10880 [Bacteroidales bacterium]|nr:hypothetical protein [Bacteroidales bacterium]
MKRYIVYLLCAVAALTSCSQEHLGELSTFNDADNKEIHFIQKSLTKEFVRGTAEGEMSVVVGRNGNKGTYRVQIQKSGKNASLFSIDETVVIPDGQYSVEVPVTVDMSSVVLGATVSASLCIIGRDAELGDDPAYISQYSDFLELKASFALEWEPYMRTTESGEEVQQTATFFYSGFYEGSQSGMLVERAVGTTNIFRLLDWAAGVPFFFKVNADNSVVVPGQSIGYLDDSVNEYVQVSDIAQYLGDDNMYAQYPCTFDGKQTFVLNLVYYVTDGIYTFGPERLVFAGDHDSDPAVAAEYNGDGTFAFSFNRFTSYCRAIAVDGDLTGDKDKLADLYKAICLGTADDIRTVTSDGGIQTWNPAGPVNTMLAVPFDSDGKAGELVTVRFTYDPDGEYMPQVKDCRLVLDEHDPYLSAKWVFKTMNVSSARVAVLEKDVLEYYMENYSNDVIFSNLGIALSAEQLERANSEGGFELPLNNLVEGETYKLVVEVTSKYGDTVMAEAEVKMASHADDFAAKGLNDFIGAFMLSASVATSDGTSTQAFRVDIIRTGENTVSIKGLCNDSNYSPSISGTYIPETHSIRVNSHNLGEYSYMNVVFGFVANLYSGIWGQTSSLEFGYGDDGYIYWRATAGSEMPVNGYKFLLFDGSSYSGYSIGDKSYTNILMMKL